MIYADHLLACRLEDLIRTEYRRLAVVARTVFPNQAVECLEVGGGVALWLGEGSPVNTAVGLGMGTPVDEAALRRLEAFYHSRGVPARTSLCPFVDVSLLHGLGGRGWTVSGFENVLVMELTGQPGSDYGPEGGPLEIRVCMPEERALWGRMASKGFADGKPPEQGEEEFGRIMAERDDAILVMAWVGGQPAGTGSLVVDGGVGWLAGDSTLLEYRRQGIQQALQRHRLHLAREAGCELGVTEAAPGSQSQRNMERLGFRIVFVHVELAKPA